jgi:Rrf2 family transcriptional regulator, cysteine metabolism repressor
LKFSTRARYGTRALLDIALNGDDGLVMLKDIAARQEISKRYLEHMMTLLKKGGLLVSERGVGGGYRLARPPEEIRLDEVFEALEGGLTPVDCVSDVATCERADDCMVRLLWCDVTDAMRSVLEKRTLADLVRQSQAHDMEKG